MDIKEIVKKYSKRIQYANDYSVIQNLKKDLEDAGYNVKDVVVTKKKLVIRTDNQIFVEIF